MRPRRLRNSHKPTILRSIAPGHDLEVTVPNGGKREIALTWRAGERVTRIAVLPSEVDGIVAALLRAKAQANGEPEPAPAKPTGGLTACSSDGRSTMPPAKRSEAK